MNCKVDNVLREILGAGISLNRSFYKCRYGLPPTELYLKKGTMPSVDVILAWGQYVVVPLFVVMLQVLGFRRIGAAIAALAGSYVAYRKITRLSINGDNRAVFITGCDSGLGYSLALHCCDSSGLTVFAGLLEPESPSLGFLRSVAEESGRIHFVPLDVTDDGSVKGAVTQVSAKLKELNLKLVGVVNNAGVMVFGEYEWLTDDLIEKQVSVNLMGTMRLTRELMPLMRQHKSRLINVTSHCGLAALPGLSVYCSTKAALNSWSDALCMELKKFGVHVVKFVPGSFVSQSRILASQSMYAQQMSAKMTSEARLTYGSYFDRYTEYLERLPVSLAPVKLRDPGIYENIDHALFSPAPRFIYVNEPWRYKVYHMLFAILPHGVIRDLLVESFLGLPVWEEQAKAISKTN